MDATLTLVKSLLAARSASGTSHVSPDSFGGTVGRHASAASVKSSTARMLFSATSAAVSVSSSPAIPSDSLSWQWGQTYDVDHLDTLALTRIPFRPAPPFSTASAAMGAGRNDGDMSTIIHGSLGSVGYSRSGGMLSGYLSSFPLRDAGVPVPPFGFRVGTPVPPLPFLPPPKPNSSSANPT